MDQAQRVAVVTGGNRGIGFEVGRQLARMGLRVILTGRDEDKARQAAETLRGEGLVEVISHPVDVTDQQSITVLGQFLRERFGRLDVLVNNAGISLDQARGLRSILDGPAVETLQETLETNLYGPLRTYQTLVPLMKGGGYGRVVNVSSQLGSLAGMGGGYQTYRISKAALSALTRILAAELRDTGILVNSACPGWVRTDMGGPDAPGRPSKGPRRSSGWRPCPMTAPAAGSSRTASRCRGSEPVRSRLGVQNGLGTSVPL